MLHSKIFRIVLLLVVIGSLCLILYSLLTRAGNRSAPTVEEEILPEEIVRKTTDFEHNQLKNGKVVFRVIAGLSTMKTGGDNVLERVSVWRFNPSGDPADMIESEEALYNPQKKEILFSGDVVIRLERGVLIYADKVHGDLVKESLLIDEDYRIEFDSVVGLGKGLEYLFISERLRFIEGMNMVLTEAAGRKEIEAGSGLYLMNFGRITLAGKARIRSPQATIEGENIEVTLDDQDQIIRISSREDARLMPDEKNTFSGDGIFLDVRNSFLTILGSESRQAVFLGRNESGSREISSDAIYCSFLSGKEDSWELNRIKAEGRVSIGLPERNLEECSGEFFQGVLVPGSNGVFESITMSGDVHIIHSGEDSRESVSGQNLLMEMDESGNPEMVTMANNVSADIFRSVGENESEQRHLEAREILRLRYEEGLLREVTGRSGCRLTGSAGGIEDHLESDSIKLEFAQGVLQRASAAGNVRGGSSDGTTERNLSSDSLDLFYTEGAFSSFRQSGAVILQETGKDRTVELRSGHSSYDIISQELKAEGGRPSMIVTQPDPEGIRKFETRAQQITVNREENKLKANGSVESIYDMKELPLVFISTYMESDLTGGEVDYSGDVRLLLEENIIKGDKMSLNSGTRELLVLGGVDTKLLSSDSESPAEYRIVAGRLKLNTEAGTAEYEEDVRFDSESLSMEAPFLVLYMKTGQMKEFSRVEAWGGVTIREEGRVWTGERAVYLKETGKVVVDGK